MSDKTSKPPAPAAGTSSTPPVNPLIPAGLELLYDTERQHLHAFVLCVHWAIVRAGLRLRSTDQQYTERLPQGWPSLVDQIADGKLILNYIDPITNNTYEFKIVEVSKNDTIVVTVFRQPSQNPAPSASTSTDSSSNRQTTSASTFRIPSYVQLESFQNSGTQGRGHTIAGTYTNSSDLEKKIWAELFEPIGLHVLGQAPVPGPYEDKTKKEEKKQESEPERVDIDYDGTYYPDPGPRPGPIGPVPLQPGGIGIGGGPLDPFGGGLGRSDLDPLGRFGAGMMADPRGFRNPPLTGPPMGPGRGQLPPGARFDPFGPVPPGRGGTRPRPGNFGQPNPDGDPPPPGFDDMFM